LALFKELCETHRVSLHAQEEVDPPG
jgi:hypothetical protein